MVAQGGLLGGYLSIRFIIIFLACFFTLSAKTFFTALKGTSVTSVTFLIVLCSFNLPGLITGTMFTWHHSLLKTFLRHPSLLLLPMFSFFTFESSANKFCQRKDSDEVQIRFSVKATYFNIIFTLMSIIVLSFIGPKGDLPLVCKSHYNHSDESRDCSLLLQFAGFPLVFLPGILLTTIFLSWCSCPNTCSCTSPSFCFFSCSTNSSCFCHPPLEFGVFKPSSPHKVFVVDQCSKEVKEVEEIEEDQADSEEREESKITGVEEIEGSEERRESKITGVEEAEEEV